VLYFPTSPNMCFCTTRGNRKPENGIFSLKCCMLFTNKCSAVAVVGDRLATIDMGRKLGGLLCPLFRGGVWEELGPHLSQCGLYQMES